MIVQVVCIANQQFWPPTCQEQQQSRECHRQDDVLDAFADLARQVWPTFDVEIIQFIANLQCEQGKPGPGTCKAPPEYLRGEQEDQESDQNMERIHADSERVLKEKFDLVPAGKGHELAVRATPAGGRNPVLINPFISSDDGDGQPLPPVKPRRELCSLDGMGPETFRGFPLRLGEG